MIDTELNKDFEAEFAKRDTIKLLSTAIKQFSPFYQNIDLLTVENQVNCCFLLAFWHLKSKAKSKIKEALKYNNKVIELISNQESKIYSTDDRFNVDTDFKNAYFQRGKTFSLLEGREEEAQKAFDKYTMYSFRRQQSIPCETMFYSYRSINTFTLKDLINNEITVVNPSKFNDPFDCLFYQLLHSQKPNSFDDKALKNSFEKVRIRSFVAEKSLPPKSEKRKIHPAYDMLMWSHYTTDHKGICVKYSLSHHFPENKPGGYSQFFNENYTDAKVVDISNATKMDITEGFLAKQKCWEHEQEIRLLYFDPECNSDYVSLPLGEESKVAAIYFGLYCSDEDVKMIQNIFKDKGVVFYKMDKSLTDIYNLTANKIE